MKLVKTRAMLLAGERGSSAAVSKGKRGRLSFGGTAAACGKRVPLPMHDVQQQRDAGGSVAGGRCNAARAALADMLGRRTALEMQSG